MDKVLNKFPLRPSYHDFADQRRFLGISNSMDTFSNLAIALPAMYLIQKQQKVSLLSVHILLLAILSTYYHVRPTHERIFWDMMALATTHAVILSFFVKEEYAMIAYICSILSVIYWRTYNDLRPYTLVILGIPLYIILTLYDNKKVTNYIYVIAGLVIMTRVVEKYDKQVYALTGKMISGHTLKHVLGGLTLWVAIIVLEKLGKI